MSRYILGLDGEKEYDSSLVGNKAFNLNELSNIGCSVPPYICITHQACLDFLEERGFPTYIKKFSSKSLSSKDLDYFLSIAREVRHYLLSRPLPPAIEKDIQEGLQKFKAGRKGISFAVRSSAVQEDTPDFSMAGQLKTFLGLKDDSEIIEKVKECWASLWREGVVKYLALREGINREIPSMGVIVQEMVPSTISGVVFTKNPVTRKDEIMIEAVRGLGYLLVKGRVEPDNYTLDKKDFSVSTNCFGKQGSAAFIERAENDRIKERPLSEEERKEKILGGPQLRALAETALKIEEQFKSPQNIEWAWDGEKFAFLQTRPITMMGEPSDGLGIDDASEEKEEPGEEKRYETEKIWTKRFFDERFPGPVSPLGWSILKDLLERRAFIEPLKYQGISGAHRYKITELFYGRPYTNLSVFYKLFYFYPSFLISRDTERLFPKKEYLPQGDRKYPYFNIKFLFSSIKTLIRDRNWVVPLHLRKWERFLKEYQKTLKELKEEDISQLSPKELFSNFTRTRTLVNDFLKIHRWSITHADILYHLSLQLMKKWNVSESLLTMPFLELENKKNITLEIDREIKKLAKMVSSSSILREFFLEDDDFDLLTRLKEVGEAKDFLKRFSDFMKQYGHRSNSLDIVCPTWEEDKGYIIGVLKNLVREKDFKEKPFSERISLKKEIKKHFATGFFNRIFPVRGLLLKRMILWTQSLVFLRENQRFYWQMAMTHMRKLILEMAGRLKKERKDAPGIYRLETLDDIFFLTIREVYDLLIEEAKKRDYQEMIQERKKEWSTNRSAFAPSFVIKENGREEEFFAERGEKHILSGMGVSPGKVSGRACVLKDLNDYSLLKKGDILVTVSLDPGWVHVLSMVSGLVLEVGGLLSHGSIIAREFGIPAVANIERATERVLPGQVISLNGTEGSVEFDHESSEK
jgi:rifampicin phosphotransferase